MKACCIVAMEMSKSPKPRHFSDSSCERWDKNRHEQRTKSYLKRKKEEDKWRKKKKKTGMHVSCHQNDVGKHASMWNGGAGWVMGIQPVCLCKEIPSLAFVCTATEEQVELLTQWPHLCHKNIHLVPHHLLSSLIIAVNGSHSSLQVELLEFCFFF